MRINATPDQLQVAVLKGDVQFEGQGGSTVLCTRRKRSPLT